MKLYTQITLSISMLLSILFMPLTANINEEMQCIDVTNNSSQNLTITAKDDSLLKIESKVPAYTKWQMISKLTKIKSAQDLLFDAIVNDSPEEIKKAILASANIQDKINGQSPMMWAISLKKYNALQMLAVLSSL